MTRARTRPMRPVGSRKAPGSLVTARRTSTGDIPSLTSSRISRCSDAPGKIPCTPESVPTNILAPASLSFRKLPSVSAATSS